MNREKFGRIVQARFAYLQTTFQFGEAEIAPTLMVDDPCVVKFESRTTIVRVSDERPGVLTLLGPAGQPRVGWLSLADVLEFLAAPTKAIEPPWFIRGLDSRTERTISLHAEATRLYCAQLLAGDFGWYLAALEWEVHRLRAHLDELGVPPDTAQKAAGDLALFIGQARGSGLFAQDAARKVE